MYLYQYAGVTIYFAESMDKISDNQRSVLPCNDRCTQIVGKSYYDK